MHKVRGPGDFCKIQLKYFLERQIESINGWTLQTNEGGRFSIVGPRRSTNEDNATE